ncbi:MAG: hypothetical protein D6785_11880, partial [Planctomycetota bacterium]
MFRKNSYILISSLLFGVIWCWGIWLHFGNWGWCEWDYAFFLHEAPRRSICRYGEFPLWNPYFFGGQTLIGHPHSRFLSPDFILVLLFGTVKGLQLQIFVYAMLGYAGMALCLRKMGVSSLSQQFGALVFMGSGFFSFHLSFGHIHFLSYSFLPWLYYFFLESQERPKFIWGLILFLALLFLSSGMTIIVLTLATLSFLSLGESLSKKDIKPFLIFLFSLLTSLALASLKLIPLFSSLQAMPSFPSILHSSSESLSFSQIIHIFWDPRQVQFMKYGSPSGFTRGWHEFSGYFGIFTFPLACWGVKKHFRELTYPILFFIFAFLCFLGNFHFFAPWNIIQNIPLLGTFFLVPSRWLFILLFFLAIFASYGMDEILQRSKNHSLHSNGMAILCLFTFLELLLVNSRALEQAFTITPPPLPSKENPKIQQALMIKVFAKGLKGKIHLKDKDILKKILQKEKPQLFIKYGNQIPLAEIVPLYGQALKKYKVSLPYGAFSSMFPALLANYGCVYGYGFSFVKPKVQWSYTIPQEIIPLRKNFTSLEYEMTMNQIRIYQAKGPEILMINQNYDAGWQLKSPEKGKLDHFKGRLVLLVPSQQSNFHLKYYPGSFLLGSFLSCALAYIFLMIWLLQW